MPKFLDYHPTLPLMTPDAVNAMLDQIGSISTSNSEVTQWNIYVGMTGQAWCICEAPDSQSVFEAHMVMGFLQREENVVEVNQLA
ncbi:MAG: hypothetical protein EXR55_04515 [Dehalococcoidia bacterium]|nr:hypothetical protein [Dehalococcoidia bacterium]